MERITFKKDSGESYSAPIKTILSDIFEIRDDKNNGNYGKESVLSVSDESGIVNQIEFQGRSFAGDDLSKYKVVSTGNIVYTRSPLKLKPFGIIKLVDSEIGIVSPLYIVNVPKHDFDSRYLYYCFDSPQRTNDYLRALVRKGAKNTMNISDSEWLSGTIFISREPEEQKKIGSLLATLDEKIILEKNKVEKLKALKASMITKMFPKEGQNVPEIRFQRFSGEWKKSKLGHISEYIREAGTGCNYVGTDNMYKHCGGVDFSNDLQKKGIKYKVGDVLVSNIRPYLEKAWLADRDGVCSTDVIVFRFTECMPEFGYIMLSDKKFFDYVMTAVGGSKMPRGDRKHIAEMPIMIPPTKAEMCDIFNVIRTIEKKIELHKYKVEKLINIKKALLEKLIGGEN